MRVEFTDPEGVSTLTPWKGCTPDSTMNFYLAGMRPDTEYRARHIARAQFLPYAEQSRKEVGYDRSADKFALSAAVTDKNVPLIFACNGEECWKSYKAATWALAEGYKTVYWFRGGLPEWRNRRFPTE